MHRNMISSNSFLKITLPQIVQNVQAHRKPRWLPVAKSKIYRIPKRPVVPVEEKMELQRIHNNYKTQMRAVRRFFFEEMIKEKSTLESETSEMSQKLDADEWERCVEVNARWNEQVAAERDQRRALQLARMETHTLARIERKDRERQERIAKASAAIKLQKELTATFITPEKLDEAIDYALANPTDYNFAIDLKGNKLSGRETGTVAKQEAAT